MDHFEILGYQPVINGLLYEDDRGVIVTGTHRFPTLGMVTNLLVKTGLVLSGMQRMVEAVESEDGTARLSMGPLEQVMMSLLSREFIKGIPMNIPGFREIIKAKVPPTYFPGQRYFSISGGSMDPEIKEVLRGGKLTYDNFYECNKNLNQSWMVQIAVGKDGKPKLRLDQLLAFMTEHQPVYTKTIMIEKSTPDAVDELELVTKAYAETFSEKGVNFGLYRIPLKHLTHSIAISIVEEMALDLPDSENDEKEDANGFTKNDLDELQADGERLFGDEFGELRVGSCSKWN